VSKPWEISGDDIAGWALRYDAAAVLPKLVRRLLAATTPLDGLEMRADAGGWDGFVRARDGTLFCPPGVSVWAPSVEEEARAKLDEDFEARTKAPPESVQPKLATYVAVVAGRFRGKERWVNEKRGRGIWLDVRLLDADDLATWLGAAPAVGRWFAGVLGKPRADVTDVEAFLEAWSRRTSPPLPWDLVLAGKQRERDARMLGLWLVDPPGRSLYVQAETREEGLLFAAAALAKDRDAERWLSRALIVESEEKWPWALALQAAEPMILLTSIDVPDPEKAASKARPILAVDRMPAPAWPMTWAAVGLERMPPSVLAEALTTSGRPAAEAERLALRSGGSLLQVQRLSGYIDMPPWAEGAPRAELMALLLAGAWAPANEEDRRVIRALGGEPADVEGMCKVLSQRVETPIVSMPEPGGAVVWKWRTPDDAWKALVVGLTEGNIREFATRVMWVLDPHRVERATPQPSAALREGLAASVARLSASDDLLRSVEGKDVGSRTATMLVRGLLKDLFDWTPWVALAPLLPTLAEAAPDAFLDALETVLSQPEQTVARLSEDKSASPSSDLPIAGLVRALETLGWSPDPRRVRRVALALAKLVLHGPAGRPRDMASKSLTGLLHHERPQSQISPGERLAILSEVFGSYFEVGWGLAIKTASKVPWVWSPVDPPRHLPWKVPSPNRKLTDEESRQQVEGAERLLLSYVDHDAGKWAKLVEQGGPLPGIIWSALEAARPHIADPKGLVWTALRWDLVLMHRSSAEFAPEEWARAKSLYAAFEPSDLSVKYGWLFQSFLELPEAAEPDPQLQQRRLNEVRAEALADLWKRDDRWTRLADLVKSMAYPANPAILGGSLALSSFATELEPRLLDGPSNPDYVGVVPLFGAMLFYNSKDLSWLERVLIRLVNLGRVSEAAGICVASDDTEELWDLVDKLGDPLRREYWLIAYVRSEHTAAQWERAVANLLEVGREIVAMMAVRDSKGAVSSVTALRVIQRVCDRLDRKEPDRDERQILHGADGDVLRVACRDPDVDPAEVVAAEIALVAHVGIFGRTSALLSRAFAAKPQLFVDIITKEPGGNLTLPYGWKGYPGDHLPNGERDAALEGFAIYVLDAAAKVKKSAIGDVAEILVRAPDGADGLWPCMAARRLLERNAYDGLAEQLSVWKRRRDHGEPGGLREDGSSERALADKYRVAAAKLQDDYPRTAAMLDKLARTLEGEAEEHDVTSAQHRIDMERFNEALEQRPAPEVELANDKPRRFVSRLETHHVEPAPILELDLARRLNLLVGDNSLGKTFVLDVLWWVLTGNWWARPARPRNPRKKDGTRRPGTPTIAASAGKRRVEGHYDPLHERWRVPKGGPLAPGLVIYAHVDGGFSVWDPIRCTPRETEGEIDLTDGYHFTRDGLWETKFARDGRTVLCKGLIDDAVNWPNLRREAYELLEKALAKLSPPPPEGPLRFGKPARFGVKEARDFPTLLMPYGQIFAVHASEAVRRTLSLAYLLVWSISEIQLAAPAGGFDPLGHVTLLVDEIEAHLHPKWQRVILPAILGVVRGLVPHARTQIVVSTHSPLVLASMETRFRDDRDALFHFALAERPAGGKANGTTIEVGKDVWRVRGDADAWLTDRDVFGLRSARGPDVEKILEEASRAMQEPDFDAAAARKVDSKLRRCLGELDPFWINWRFIAEKRGWIHS
jgi:hypothetical protein